MLTKRRGSIKGRGSTIFLLYLNDLTFAGLEGRQLEDDLLTVLEKGQSILVVHENDTDKGGCTFAYFYQVTPQSLLDVQLYSREQYFAWSIGSHRQISIKLSARAIGARELTAEELAVRVADRSSAEYVPGMLRAASRLMVAGKRGTEGVVALGRGVSTEALNAGSDMLHASGKFNPAALLAAAKRSSIESALGSSQAPADRPSTPAGSREKSRPNLACNMPRITDMADDDSDNTDGPGMAQKIRRSTIDPRLTEESAERTRRARNGALPQEGAACVWRKQSR